MKVQCIVVMYTLIIHTHKQYRRFSGCMITNTFPTHGKTTKHHTCLGYTHLSSHAPCTKQSNSCLLSKAQGLIECRELSGWYYEQWWQQTGIPQ